MADLPHYFATTLHVAAQPKVSVALFAAYFTLILAAARFGVALTQLMETNHTDSRRMTRRSFRLPLDTIQLARAAAHATGTSLVDLLSDALVSHVAKLGGPFGEAPAQLPNNPGGPDVRSARRRRAVARRAMARSIPP
jgi:hypothetical protein